MSDSSNGKLGRVSRAAGTGLGPAYPLVFSRHGVWTEEIMTAIAARVFFATRTIRGLTQRDMATRLGIDQTTYNLNERGLRFPRVEAAARFAAHFHCTLDAVYFADLDGYEDQGLARSIIALFPELDRVATKDKAQNTGKPQS